MKSTTTIDDLIQTIKEIQKIKRRERLRQILKILLIGFLLKNENKKKINFLITRANQILDQIIESCFKDVENNSLYEKPEIFFKLQNIEKVLKSSNDVFDDNNSKTFEHKIQSINNELTTQIEKVLYIKLENVTQQVNSILDSCTYLINSDQKQVLIDIETLEKGITHIQKLPKLNKRALKEKLDKLDSLKRNVLNYNSNFIKQRKNDYSFLWTKKNFSLDDEQQTAIVTDDKHNLVVAAAGSGKTEVLITRIAYIAKRKPDSSPQNKILAIAYQRKAREEIEKRLKKRFDLTKVNVSTFHKLGKNILEEARSRYSHTDIINDNKKNRIIGKIFESAIKQDPDFFKLFLDFIKVQNMEEQSETEEKEKNLEYSKGRAYIAIDGTRVNSRDEKEIMDFFLTHKLNKKDIKVIFETDLDCFRPDFYLPEYDLFMEHWGLNENGEVPKWFSQTSEQYKQSMNLKKQWFFDHNKSFIETFSYEYNPKDPYPFTELLKNRISEFLQKKFSINFEFELKSYDEIVELAWDSYRTPIEEIATFITTAKTYGLSPEKIQKRLRESNWSEKQIAFGKLVLPVFEKYQEIIQLNDKIDFEDMINLAINELEKKPNLRRNCYDHILIDEYQDISAQRYALIKILMDRNPNCKLFCVGDDWQSIMSFSGSNINFFVNFSKYFENPAITIISTNYRSTNTIVDAGANLIRNNTSCQIQKPTHAKQIKNNPIQLYCSQHKKNFKCSYHDQIAEHCINQIIDYLKNGYKPNDILVITRCLKTRTKYGYQFVPVVKLIRDLAEENNLSIIHENWQKTNNIRLLTAHGSKGLEAKIVFLLDVIDDTFGFPCKIEDSNIIELARIDYPPQDRIEQERRLFYVAMTRAIEELNIYTWDPAKSDFIFEIENYTKEITLPC